ncbi:hypothetical protein [Caballeronia sp. HLA56]
MFKYLISIISAAAMLSACTTDTGMAYTARKVNIANQGEAYRVTCSGLFESQKSCMSAATKICQDRQVVLVQAVDGLQGNQGRNDPREITFTCGSAASTAHPAY